VDLPERHSPGRDVFLIWGRRGGRLWELVTYRATDRTARVEASKSNALDVFNHPFAYPGGAR